MLITWLGHACFHIKTNGLTVITDPYDSKIGFELPQNLEANVVTVSHGHHDHSNTKAVGGNPEILNKEGDFEIHGLKVRGIKTFHDEKHGSERGENIVFVFEIEGLRVCHLGDLGHILNEETLQKIGKVDVLMIPIGGNYTIDHKKAWDVIGQIKPRVVIPMHYKIEGLKVEINSPDTFIKMLKLPPGQRDYLEIEKNKLEENSGIIMLSKASQIKES